MSKYVENVNDEEIYKKLVILICGTTCPMGDITFNIINEGGYVGQLMVFHTCFNKVDIYENRIKELSDEEITHFINELSTDTFNIA